MKISTLTTWQFVGLMVVILVGTSVIFRVIEKQIYKQKKKPMDVPLPPTDGGTAIDTANGLVYRR